MAQIYEKIWLRISARCGAKCVADLSVKPIYGQVAGKVAKTLKNMGKTTISLGMKAN
jgi:hypothetical protein